MKVSCRALRSQLIALALALLSAGITLAPAAVRAASKRVWLPQDSSSVRYVAIDPRHPIARHQRSGESAEGSGSAIEVSPDGRRFFFLTSWGDIEADSAVCELFIYDVEVVNAWQKQRSENLMPKPSRQMRMRSSSSISAAIESASWTPDSNAVLLLGVTAQGTQELYRLDAHSGALDQLTQGAYRYPDRIEWYASDGKRVLFQDARGREFHEAPYPASLVRRRVDGTVWREAELRVQTRRKTINVMGPGEGVRVLSLRGDIDGERIWISPNGQWAISVRWEFLPDKLSGTYVLIDLEHAREVRIPRLQGEPFSSKKKLPQLSAFWSADSTRVILVNTRAPQQVDDSLHILDYEVDSGRWSILETLWSASGLSERSVDRVEWLREGHEVLVTRAVNSESVEDTVYSFRPNGVQSRMAESAAKIPPTGPIANGLTVRLVQGANDPPRIVVSDDSHERVLWGPDPTLEKVRLVRSELFQWQEGKGRTITGGLTLPPVHPGGQPVPLVIQAYYYVPEKFLPDGPHAASDAVQALAARGMAVLQIDLPWVNITRTLTKAAVESEGHALSTRIDSAIAALSHAGVIDAKRVGMTGFSRGGYGTYYAITHPGRARLSAAVSADFFHGSYSEYLSDVAAFRASSGREEFEDGPGGPFSQRKLQWLQYETTFNVDKVDTPILMTLHGSDLEYGEDFSGRDATRSLETIGALAHRRKSFQYVYLPAANHWLVRPLEQIALMDTVVDWMSFWLQGYEDPSPHKTTRYESWRGMRAGN